MSTLRNKIITTIATFIADVKNEVTYIEKVQQDEHFSSMFNQFKANKELDAKELAARIRSNEAFNS